MAMDISFTNNGDGTHTLRMDFTGPSDKLIELGSDAGEFYYDVRWGDGFGEVTKTFDELTNQQKLDVLGKEVKSHLKNGAYEKYSDDTIQAARDDMDTIEEKYNMEY